MRVVPMIQPNHPEWPGVQHRDDLKYIGYWRTGKVRETLPHFPDPHDFIVWDWEWRAPLMRHKLAAYLNTCGKVLYHWLGTSTCRVCGQRPCTDLGLLNSVPRTEREDFRAFCLTDGVYAWPSGFAHYVLVHHIRPPDEFLEHVFANLPE